MCLSISISVWSFGIVCWEVATKGEEPLEGMDIFDVAIKIRDEGLTPDIPKKTNKKMRKLMKMCWKMEPKERATFDEICLFCSEVEDESEN